ncbi:MAG TPA: DUF1361 domain-containing protein [Candidatus Paceibacterota bacterium]|nr:DUF1361 domain-containing protein [Candidatus Paceibacterota bacterium]
MKLLRIAFRPETVAPMCALTFGSAITVALVFAQMLWTDHLRYGFLIWNLFLAWLPLIFALLAAEQLKSERGNRWLFFPLAAAWLLFFPNAPYICTDLVHLPMQFHRYFWVDLILILLPAFSGLMLAFLSLYLMQSVVARRFGAMTGWGFVAAIAGLSSFGVYLGRFLRFNSWDVFVRPLWVCRGLDAWFGNPMLRHHASGFLILFAAFLFVAYLMLYALTHLSPAQSIRALPAAPNLNELDGR